MRAMAVGVLLGLAVASLFFYANSKQQVQHEPVVQVESTYERILRTGVIRCGYINWAPAIYKDVLTGDMQGYVPAYIEAMAESLDLNVEWTEELNLSTYLVDLANGRYDLECAGGWASATRGKYIYYTEPFAYQAAVPFVRADDTRFDAGIETLYRAGLTAAVMDGDTSQDIREQQFPNMQEVSLPQIASPLEYFSVVSSGKADVTFSDIVGGLQYMQSNPGKVKALPYRLRLVPMCIGVPPGEERLLRMLNTANQQLKLTGQLDALLNEYETTPGMFVRTTSGLGLAPQMLKK